jgi:amino acid transporter
MRLILGLGFLLLISCVAVHASTFVTDREPLSIGVLFLMAIPMFALFLKAVLVLRKKTKGGDRNEIWKRAYSNVPRWVPILTLLILAYTGFNFFYSLLVLNDGLTPSMEQGRYVMQDHGHVVREISQVDYWRHSAYQLRGMSTHLILFTAVALGVLWSEHRKNERMPNERS